MARSIPLLVAAIVYGMPAYAQLLGSDWSYEGVNGPEQWSARYPQCGGKEQSPVDLQSNCTYQPFAAFSGTVLNVTLGAVNMTIQNMGHTVALTPMSDVSVSGGNLSSVYHVAAVHFHWGNVSTRGSEHTIGGKRFPMELHMVTYKYRYSSLGAALNSLDREAVAVLAVFMEVKSNVSTASTAAAIDAIAGILPNVTTADSSMNVTIPMSGVATAFRSVLSTSPFYRYLGSLTTPGCDQKVAWTVFRDTLGITEAQLNAFRSLETRDTSRMVDNYRPTQSINGRTVYCSTISLSTGSNSAARVANVAHAAVILLTVVLVQGLLVLKL